MPVVRNEGRAAAEAEKTFSWLMESALLARKPFKSMEKSRSPRYTGEAAIEAINLPC